MLNNEDGLFRKMQEGDWTAFNLFFREYMEELYLYAYAFVKEREVAEDIVQDVFIYLWTNRSKISYTGPVCGYLMRAVKNACINHRVHTKVKEKYQQEVLMSGSEIPEETENIEELCRKLNETIDKLPPKCREIFVMGCVEGLTYSEIADQLEVSVNTVKTQMKFAYRKIRNEMDINSAFVGVLVMSFSKLFSKE